MIGDAMENMVGTDFFDLLLKFMCHLTQKKLIADVGTTCAHVENCWLLTYKITDWFKAYRLSFSFDTLHLLHTFLDHTLVAMLTGLSCCNAELHRHYTASFLEYM